LLMDAFGMGTTAHEGIEFQKIIASTGPRKLPETESEINTIALCYKAKVGVYMLFGNAK
jgi:hypothetical protein